MLEGPDQAKLRDLSNELVATVNTGSKRKAMTSSSSTTQPSDKDEAKKRQKENEKNAVMSIFG